MVKMPLPGASQEHLLDAGTKTTPKCKVSLLLSFLHLLQEVNAPLVGYSGGKSIGEQLGSFTQGTACDCPAASVQVPIYFR